MDFECERRRREENFEFLDSLECYFTYFRMRFEEKLLSQKGIFMIDRKNIYVKHCTLHANTTAKQHDVFLLQKSVMTAVMRANSSSNVLSTTIGIVYWSQDSRQGRLQLLLVNRRDGYHYITSAVLPPIAEPPEPPSWLRS